MKTFVAPFVVLLLAAQATTARAEPAASPVDLSYPTVATAPQADLFRPDLERRAHDARKLRNAGIVTTVVGAVAAGAGAGLFVAALHGSCSGDACGLFDAIGGGVLMGVGGGAMLAGIPMLAIGSSRERALGAQLSLTAGGFVGRF